MSKPCQLFQLCTCLSINRSNYSQRLQQLRYIFIKFAIVHPLQYLNEVEVGYVQAYVSDWRLTCLLLTCLEKIVSGFHGWSFNIGRSNALIPPSIQTHSIQVKVVIFCPMWPCFVPSVNSNWIYNAETPNSGQNRRFFSCVNWKFDGWPWKTTGYLCYAASCCVHNCVVICEFEMDLRSRNGWIGFWPLWPWPLIFTFCLDIISDDTMMGT